MLWKLWHEYFQDCKSCQVLGLLELIDGPNYVNLNTPHLILKNAHRSNNIIARSLKGRNQHLKKNKSFWVMLLKLRNEYFRDCKSCQVIGPLEITDGLNYMDLNTPHLILKDPSSGNNIIACSLKGRNQHIVRCFSVNAPKNKKNKKQKPKL